MARSILFTKLEKEIKALTKNQLEDLATNSLKETFDALNSTRKQELAFALMFIGFKIGFCGDKKISSEEKFLIEKIFKKYCSGDISQIYSALDNRIDEDDYMVIKSVIALGNNVAIPFLKYVLCLAYIDDILEQEVADRLDDMYGTVLMLDLFHKETKEGIEPSRDVLLSSFEAEIIVCIKCENKAMSINDVARYFPNISRTDLCDAVKKLWNNGLLVGSGATGATYRLGDLGKFNIGIFNIIVGKKR